MEFPRLPLAAYTVAWICALSVELKAALAMLDKEHQDPPAKPQETNSYCLGSIGRHNVVIVCPPSGRYGTNAAADCVGRMMEKFPSVKYGFLVGIAGGVPTDKDDIRLGDVVISQPQGLHGGAIQHDLQKIGAGGKSIRTGYLSPPPTTLLNALTKFQTSGKDRRSHIEERLLLVNAVEKPKSDILYESTYHHVGLDECSDCDPTKVKQRGAPKPTIVHYGLVASGNSVVKDGVTRDRLSRELGGALCFEMEAAGVMNSLPCLVIRGICDYCDSHKNKEWQSYAAVVAAICAREFFEIMPAVQGPWNL
ncbi:5'-methylthioadenosine/S-adenosylhomocysteine nucleosidase [Aspergillus stella-maris]|uniref:5'-methylthioadenosine/S-adenosylhomocysteine nucleosidase n=1 Tax=Aspergillus stella-maris TaxID=1810926 RepID=UPI003CCD7490